MKAGWIFTPNEIVDGGNQPYFPPGVSPGFTSINPVEIHRLTGSAVPHVHLLVNGVALANDFLAAHEHYAIGADGVYFQVVKAYCRRTRGKSSTCWTRRERSAWEVRNEKEDTEA